MAQKIGNILEFYNFSSFFDWEKQEQTCDSFTRHALIQKRNVRFENAWGCSPVDRPRGWGHCLACSCKGWGHSETWDSAWWLRADCSGSSQTHPAPAASAGRSSLYLRNTSRAEWTRINHYKTLWIFCLVHYFATFKKRNGSFTCTNLTNTKGDHFVRFSDILGHKSRKMMITEHYIKLIIWWKPVEHWSKYHFLAYHCYLKMLDFDLGFSVICGPKWPVNHHFAVD